MNGDALELAKLINQNHADLTQRFSTFTNEFSKFQGNIEARVSAVEKTQEKADSRQWLHSAVVTIVGLVHHELLSRLGWKL